MFQVSKKQDDVMHQELMEDLKAKVQNIWASPGKINNVS